MQPIRLVATVALAWAASLAPAHAAFQVENVEVGCNGELSVSGVDAFVLNCSADLTLRGLSSDAYISAPASIHIFSSGHMALSNLRLAAPEISLASDTGVLIDGSLTLASAPDSWTPTPTVSISAGGTRLSNSPDSGPRGGVLSIGGSGDVRLVAGQVFPADSGVQVTGGSLQVYSVPEPSTGALLAGGMLALLIWQRRHRG